MIPVDGKFLLAVAPRFSGSKAADQARIIEAISYDFAETLEEYEITSLLRIAHFTAQIAHESAGFRTTEEFASGAAYEGRKDLGNIRKGDGRLYKGRGLLQLTGRANYRRMGKILDLPLESEPDLAAAPQISLEIAGEYWKDRKINKRADQDDLIRVTKLVNGGRNGLDDRRWYLQRAKIALSRIEADRVFVAQEGVATVLSKGADGKEVEQLQRLLVARGFVVAVDGDFGPATEGAVIMFQQISDLTVDGIVGHYTWEALGA